MDSNLKFPEYADIIVSLDENVLNVTLNRPHRKNALRAETVSELIHVLELADASNEARCVLLSGAGKFFCSGGDLKAMGGAAAEDKPSPIPVDMGGFPKLCLTIEKLGTPIVAKIEGSALAGGMGLMLCCHVAIAADNATFGTPEIKRGLWPMMIMRPIFATMPKRKALEMILTGRIIDATEAERIGVITKSVPADKLDEEVKAVAGTISGYSPAIMRLGLKAMGEQFKMHSDEAYPYLEAKLREVATTEDFREGVIAFAQKRKPVWKGK